MSLEKYDPYDFANRRHIGPTQAEIDSMLRPAVHFCMSPAGFANRVRYT